MKVSTSAFVGTNPMDESIVSDLPVVRQLFGNPMLCKLLTQRLPSFEVSGDSCPLWPRTHRPQPTNSVGARTASQDIDVQTAAEFLLTTISGMKVAARGGATPESLQNIARMAIRSLK